MLNTRVAVPVILYFYQGDITQDEVDKVLSAFKDKQVNFRKVTDINDTRDIVERCDYVSGTVPLIYFVRKAPGVATGGVLADPLGRKGATSATAKKSSGVEVEQEEVTVTTGHVAPTDANIAASLLKEEIEQATAKKEEPDIKADEVKVDENATATANSVTGQLPADATKPAQAPKPVAAPAQAPKAPTK